jgi:hypothetical protein
VTCTSFVLANSGVAGLAYPWSCLEVSVMGLSLKSEVVAWMAMLGDASVREIWPGFELVGGLCLSRVAGGVCFVLLDLVVGEVAAVVGVGVDCVSWLPKLGLVSFGLDGGSLGWGLAAVGAKALTIPPIVHPKVTDVTNTEF